MSKRSPPPANDNGCKDARPYKTDVRCEIDDSVEVTEIELQVIEVHLASVLQKLLLDVSNDNREGGEDER